MSWNGTIVRHEDGRAGTLRDAGLRGGSRVLTVEHDGQAIGTVTISMHGWDSGDAGWWFLSQEDGYTTWIQLGDHWAPEAKQ